MRVPRFRPTSAAFAALAAALLFFGCAKKVIGPGLGVPNFRVQVLEVGGAPAVNAAITLATVPAGSTGAFTTDDRGLLWLYLDPGTYVVNVISADRNVGQDTLVAPTLGGAQLGLTVAGAFRGRVLGHGGAPIESATVACLSNRGPTVLTDAAGRYLLGEIPRGTVELAYGTPDRPGASYHVFNNATLPAAGDTVTLGDVQLTPPAPGAK